MSYGHSGFHGDNTGSNPVDGAPVNVLEVELANIREVSAWQTSEILNYSSGG
jgi:hypothetical protein